MYRYGNVRDVPGNIEVSLFMRPLCGLRNRQINFQCLLLIFQMSDFYLVVTLVYARLSVTFDSCVRSIDSGGRGTAPVKPGHVTGGLALAPRDLVLGGEISYSGRRRRRRNKISQAMSAT